MKKLFAITLLLTITLAANTVFALESTSEGNTNQTSISSENAKDLAKKKKELQEQITAKKHEIVETTNAKRMNVRQKNEKILQLNQEIKNLQKELKLLK